MYVYPAYFYKEDNVYSVIFHDLDLATYGKTLEEAIIMAEEVLTGRIYLMLKDGDVLPKPTSIENIKNKEEASFVSLVKTDKKYLEKEKCVRKNLTLPAWLAEAAENANLNFSQELQNALKTKLKISL